MKNIGMLKAMRMCAEYEKLNAQEREALQRARLKELVSWARSNSPYYKQLYKDVGEDFALSDLPVVNKVELMAHWNDWVTDSALTLDGVNGFMRDIDNVGRQYLGKYMIFTTSGSTGNPLVAVCDKMTNSVMSAVNARRTFARKEDLSEFMKRGARTIGVFATGGFYLGNSSVRARLLQMPWKKRQMAVTSALLPIDKIVSELNSFKPVMLGGYPSNLELLIDEAQSGRLNISPVLIMTGGEYLSDSLRERLANTFHCYVQTSYSCTEGGTMACECVNKHFHINDDWLILEPVDNNYKPVPAGVRGDKLLLTNLYNYTQPYIRYEITDRVVLHDEACPCGNKAPWLTLEGRTDDVVSFKRGDTEVKLAPLAIYATLKEVHELKRFQFIVRNGKDAQLRIEPASGISREEAFEKAVNALTPFFALHGLSDVPVSLSPDEPKQDSGSGKFKHIIRA